MGAGNCRRFEYCIPARGDLVLLLPPPATLLEGQHIHNLLPWDLEWSLCRFSNACLLPVWVVHLMTPHSDVACSVYTW